MCYVFKEDVVRVATALQERAQVLRWADDEPRKENGSRLDVLSFRFFCRANSNSLQLPMEDQSKADLQLMLDALVAETETLRGRGEEEKAAHLERCFGLLLESNSVLASFVEIDDEDKRHATPDREKEGKLHEREAERVAVDVGLAVLH